MSVFAVFGGLERNQRFSANLLCFCFVALEQTAVASSPLSRYTAAPISLLVASVKMEGARYDCFPVVTE